MSIYVKIILYEQTLHKFEHSLNYLLHGSTGFLSYSNIVSKFTWELLKFRNYGKYKQNQQVTRLIQTYILWSSGLKVFSNVINAELNQ